MMSYSQPLIFLSESSGVLKKKLQEENCLFLPVRVRLGRGVKHGVKGHRVKGQAGENTKTKKKRKRRRGEKKHRPFNGFYNPASSHHCPPIYWKYRKK